MNKKYELTNETLELGSHLGSHTLHRIRALRDFGCVKAGDLGGWVESERNLSHEGNCWIADEAKAYGSACLSGNAHAYDNAELFDNAHAYDNAELFDNARLSDRARASGNTRLYDRSHAFGNAHLSGNARAYNRASLSDNMYATRDVMHIGGLRWPVTISDNHIRIGCQTHTIDEWAKFSDKKIAAMSPSALKFWKKWGNAILTIAKEHREGVGGKSDS